MKRQSHFRIGEWIPSDQDFFEDWLKGFIERIEKEDEKPLVPPVQELKDLIESDRLIFNLFADMFSELPETAKFEKSVTDKPQVRDYKHMLQLINGLMDKCPEYNEYGQVGCPINAILNWPMGTYAGYIVFSNEKVNKIFKKILNYWKKFLDSPASAEGLNTGVNGWLSEAAQKKICKTAGYPELSFLEIFKHRSEKIEEHYGYTCWNDFFTREFQEGLRPVASPEDDYVIANACESGPFKITYDIAKKAKFWIKSQPYSLVDMMDNDPLTDKFVGGTVYQAFLSALSYHRWHAPVSGKIVKVKHIDGSYYSEDYFEGFINPEGPDPMQANCSQPYLSEVAARAAIFIEADNKDIGLVCLIPIGMGEVSFCDVIVKEGDHVKKGDQLGMFKFGGSTHCLIFQKGVEIEWDLHGQEPNLNAYNIPVRSKLGTVKPKK